MLEIKEDIYVVVCERDCPSHNSEMESHGPIILETYLSNASKKKAEEVLTRFSGTFGECKIGKVIFKPKMIVPDWIRKLASKALESEKQQELLRELTLGFIDADKWEIENDEDYLQF